MHAFQALWHKSHQNTPSGDSVAVEIKSTGLSFSDANGAEQLWPFAVLRFQKKALSPREKLFIHHNTEELEVSDFKILNTLLPHLSGPQRTQALEIYGTYRSPKGKRMLSLVLFATVLMGFILWLFFWGQIQLRKQQLALADKTLPQSLGKKHEQDIAQTHTLCEGPQWQKLTQQLLQEYQIQSKTNNLRKLTVFDSPQIEALMLSNGHLLLSTALIKDMSWPALLAFFAHEEGHLMLNHRLESRIYTQGNQIFKRLWQQGDDKAYLLDAPLWAQYSRGQEAAADYWAFTHIPQENAQFDFKLLAKKSLLYLDDPTQKKGFVARHPWATDRLQSTAQRLSPSVEPTYQQNATLAALQKKENQCQ